MSIPKRIPVPTLSQLIAKEESTRERVIDQSARIGAKIQDDDVGAIKRGVVRLKACITEYEAASRALSTWYSTHGSISLANETRNCRLALVHHDCRDVIKDSNTVLQTRGCDAVSSIGASSRVQLQVADQRDSDDTSGDSNSVIVPHEPDVPVLTPAEKVNTYLNKSLAAVSIAPDVQQEIKLLTDFKKEEIEDVEVLDPITRRQLKQELLRGCGEPFSGDPEHFWTWKDQLSRRLLESQAGALDSLYVIKANTSGRPMRIVSESLAAGARNPKETLAAVWSLLCKRFGRDEVVSAALLSKLSSFPAIKNSQNTTQMEDLLSLCKIILSNMDHCSELKFMNLQSGMKMVWEKLPLPFQHRWRKQCHNHDKATGSNPSFETLIASIEDFIDELSVPSFDCLLRQNSNNYSTGGRQRKTLHTEADVSRCLYHDTDGHSIISCSAFKRLSYFDRKKHAIARRLCFACLEEHRWSECPRTIKCSKCNGPHTELMHRDGNSSLANKNGHNKYKEERGSVNSTRLHNYRNDQNSFRNDSSARNNCLNACSMKEGRKVCSKTVLVDVRMGKNGKRLRCLCVLDEQSNTTFCDPKIVKFFNLHPETQTYSLTTMTGYKTATQGQVVEGLQVKGVTEREWIALPTTLTHSSIPDTREEMASPSMVASHPHIKHLAQNFPILDKEAEVLLLVGADCGKAMLTKSHGNHYPFAHHTSLGWALVGPVCGDQDQERKTFRTTTNCEHFQAKLDFDKYPKQSHALQMFDTFAERADDDLPGLSRNDVKFLEVISNGISINEKGNIEMPLPLKENISLQNNQAAVFGRTQNTLERLRREPEKLSQCIETMKKYISEDHVEQLPPHLGSGGSNVNYLAIFPVTHPKKNKTRLVFDSAAKYAGVSLNDCLLQGPDENNRIVGVLTRFRHGEIAFSGDIECMFHSFYVSPEHRDLQRFYWFRDNDPSNPIVTYRAKVHVFGNCSSPAVATYGLRYTTTHPEAVNHKAACSFIKDNTYVDDGLGCSDTVAEAVDILKKARTILGRFNIRMHKIVATRKEILDAFPPSEHASEVDAITLSNTPLQRTLGISWSIAADIFILKCDLPKRSYTKRGVLSTVNSLFDPLGIVSPVVLTGRLLQRKFIPQKSNSTPQIQACGWDDPLPEEHRDEWNAWILALSQAEEVTIPRSFPPVNFGKITRRELHVLSDASDNAIGHVIYIRMINSVNCVHVAFVAGSSKVAPRAATSIPRLELCAAAEAAHAARYMQQELGRHVDSTTFYTDSRVVLGYLNNHSKRFSRYVTTRINSVLTKSSASQWCYIHTSENTADIASRPQTPKSLLKTRWFQGPSFLWKNCSSYRSEDYSVDTNLPETQENVKTLHLNVKQENSSARHVYTVTNSWPRAKRIISYVLMFICRTRLRKECSSLNLADLEHTATNFLLREAQKEDYRDAYNRLRELRPLHNDDKLASLSPFIDEDGLIRVGGRLRHSSLLFGFKHPILLPPKHPLSIMILRYYHEKTYHQGRHLTMGSLCQAGYHLHKGRHTIRKLLAECVVCQRLRGIPQTQMMADLPADRLEECPPFSNVGIDVFGPHLIHDGITTRNRPGTKKIWALLITCLNSRAVHIEPLTSLDTVTFKLALRRFIAIRGNCKRIRSDQGTNFVGARNEMAELPGVDTEEIKKAMQEVGCTWELNTPGASHMGGVWERKVGAIKKILNAALLQLNNRTLSRDELYTLLQEAACIVNNTPLYECSSNPNDPAPISPAMLLTLRDNPNPPPPEAYSPADLLQYGRARWRRTQYLANQFWVRWRLHYLTELQERNKWKQRRPCISVDDIVMLKGPAARNTWPTARVIDVHPNKDGLPRSVTLRVPSSENNRVRVLKRAIHDLVLLIPKNKSN